MSRSLWFQMLAARYVALLPLGVGLIGVGYSGEA